MKIEEGFKIVRLSYTYSQRDDETIKSGFGQWDIECTKEQLESLQEQGIQDIISYSAMTEYSTVGMTYITIYAIVKDDNK